VQADHHGLLQVFLNLARNAQRAIGASPRKELSVEATTERDLVVVRFRDSGAGVANPDLLFKPFQSGENSVGLGLYISRAILRAHSGELRYESQGSGTCFVVELWPAEGRGHA
jgi:C4-dicarboxylate-specific signal transduction histidine kinase